ncbi:MAG: hypothetical protein QOD77_726 [Thermoplasmata archaeon]|jgi:exosortase/archaeosortase family protein|nr:hypothetical protein [Thermoplasmata archaeon]
MGGLRSLLGLLLAGYGLLVLLGLLAHESPVAGFLSLAAGAAILAFGLPRIQMRRGRWVAALGAALVVGTIAVNAVRANGLGLPEWGLLAYGAALLASSPFLDRKLGKVEVGSLVGWSFPLLLAPMVLFASNAMVSSPEAGSGAAGAVASLVVAPTAFGLVLLGTPVEVVGHNLVLETPRGGLTLGVGLVCAGLYPIVLFLGLVGLHAWQTKMPGTRLAATLLLGLAGLWVMNILRLVILARIGIAWGPAALQTAHAHMGWILFALFMACFWFVVLRRWEPKPEPEPKPAD